MITSTKILVGMAREVFREVCKVAPPATTHWEWVQRQVEQFSSYIIHGKSSRVMVARVPARPDVHVFHTHCLADITGFVQ